MNIVNYLLLAYPAFFLIIYFWGCTIHKKNSAVATFLSPEQTRRIQGLACIGVVLHHLTQQITSYGELNKGPITILSSMGILFTAIFFFVSGYGLMVSLDVKEHYLDTFLLHRIPTILIPFWISNIIFVVYQVLDAGYAMQTKTIINFIVGFKLINSNGWFLIEILFFYLAFYILFRFIKNRDVALAILCVFSIFLLLYSKSLGHDNDLLYPNSSWFKGEWWYNATIVFPMGLLFGRFRNRIYAFIKKFYFPLLITVIIAFAATFYYEEHTLKIYGYYRDSFSIGGMTPGTRTLISQMAVNLICTLVIVIMSVKLETRSKFFAFVGSFSMEMFLIHHLFMDLISGTLVKNYFVRFGLVIITSAIGAFILSKIDRIILAGINKLTGRLINKKSANQDEVTIERRIKEEQKKKNRIKIAILAGVIIVGITIYELLASHILYRGKEAREEVRALQNAQVGDEVYWGYFDTDIAPFKERVSWVVIAKADNQYTLLSKMAIDSSEFNKAYSEIGWADSGLRQRLSSSEYTSMFSSYELGYMVADELGDYISIPTVNMVRNLTNIERMAFCTEVALQNGANSNLMSKANYWDFNDQKASWWWLRNDDANEASMFAPIVTVDGDIEPDTRYVNKPGGAIRPVIIVEIH